MKICRCCKIEKSESDFFNRSDSRDGLRNECKRCFVAKHMEWKRNNKDWIRANNRKHAVKIAARLHRNYVKNREARLESMCAYRRKNWDRLYQKQKDSLKNDLTRKLAMRLRIRLAMAFKLTGERKAFKTSEMLGCSIPSFKMYIESKFEPGMTWENYSHSGWHIDHIIPCALFDLSKPEHQKRCFHFSNLQPMWAFNNHSKHDKVLKDHQFEFIELSDG